MSSFSFGQVNAPDGVTVPTAVAASAVNPVPAKYTSTIPQNFLRTWQIKKPGAAISQIVSSTNIQDVSVLLGSPLKPCMLAKGTRHVCSAGSHPNTQGFKGDPASTKPSVPQETKTETVKQEPPVKTEQARPAAKRHTKLPPATLDRGSFDDDGVAKGGIQLSKRIFGHTFSEHGEDQTNYLINRAKGSGMAQGQFLDNHKAAKFIFDNVSKTSNGAINLPIPNGFPARVIMPDGTFRAATHIRLVPGGGGVKTAYPLVP